MPPAGHWALVRTTIEPAEGTPLVYQCALPLSRQTLPFAADLLRAHLKKIGSRWRKLRPRKIALIVLATLRHDHRLADLAGGNGVSASTIRRWTWEIVGLLAARSATMLKIPSSSIAALPPRHLLPRRPEPASDTRDARGDVGGRPRAGPGNRQPRAHPGHARQSGRSPTARSCPADEHARLWRGVLAG